PHAPRSSRSRARVGGAWSDAGFLERGQAALGFLHVGIGFIPGVARKNGADVPRHLRVVLLVKDCALKSAAVPRLDERAEGVDAFLERFGEILVPIHRLAVEFTIETRAREARRLEGDGHTAREHRIEKLTGIAEQRK